MSNANARRAELWSRLQGPWDLVIVGGGITGAGILSEATARGLKALLVEQRDFAWGTSSRSSKLVHGGLRYLAQRRLRLVWESVREREQLLREGPGIVEPMSFLLASYRGDRPGRWSFAAALSIYDVIAGCWRHEYLNRDNLRKAAPHLSGDMLLGGYRYHDASTDDARLVLRVLHEAVRGGATAVNYATADEVIREDGKVVGVRLRDTGGELPEVVCRARVVVNATGAWADRLRSQVDGGSRMRPLRGSHLVFSGARFPLSDAIALLHPLDRRTVFVFPWEGASVVGTTDLDHEGPLDQEPAVTPGEVAYLMALLEMRFPSLQLGLDDIMATYSGVRPVVNTGKSRPSDETREHVIWEESGLVTVTGGKLTTFRLIARDALKAIHGFVEDVPVPKGRAPTLLQPAGQEALDAAAGLPEHQRNRLLGRHGANAAPLLQAAQPGGLEAVGSTSFYWAELQWAARSEWVVHLDDILLRRVRAGILLPEGGNEYLPRVRALCQHELGWSDARWQAEEERYLQLWREHYSLPERSRIPDWREQIRTHAASAGEGQAYAEPPV